MTFISKMLAGAAGVAAIAGAASPAAAQYYNPYGYQQSYGYQQPYQQSYGYSQYGYNPYAQQATSMATQRCASAVQYRLSRQQQTGISGILGAVLGVQQQSQARVVGFTRVEPRRSNVRVTGLASSGRYAGGYSPYGYGAYGASAYGYQPDLQFRCTVDYQGRIRDIDFYRR